MQCLKPAVFWILDFCFLNRGFKGVSPLVFEGVFVVCATLLTVPRTVVKLGCKAVNSKKFGDSGWLPSCFSKNRRLLFLAKAEMGCVCQPGLTSLSTWVAGWGSRNEFHCMMKPMKWIQAGLFAVVGSSVRATGPTFRRLSGYFANSPKRL